MSAPENPAQAQIEADVAQISADFTTLVGIFSQLQNLVAEAVGNGTPVSTASLDALVAQGASVTQNYQGLVNPTPEPAPEDSP